MTRQHSSGRSHHVPRAPSSTSISAEGSFLPSKSDLTDPWTAVANPSEIVTPDIGQGKEIGAPVAGPTVVPIRPSEMIWTDTTSASSTSFMGSFTSKPQSSSVKDYDYDAHRRARTARREEEEERGKRRQRSGSQTDSPPPRSRSRHRDSPPRQGRQRTRPVTPLSSRPPSRSPSPPIKTVPRVATIPYPSQQSSEMSYMFYDPELHGVGPPPPPPPALRALSSQANIGAKTAPVTSVPSAAASSTVPASPDPPIHERPNSLPPRPPRRGSPPRGAQTDTTATAPSAPPQSSYAPAYNYASIHSVYMQSQPASGAPASSAYQATTPADFIQQGYYQAAAAPMIPLYPAPPAHTLVTSAASSPYYASAAPPAASSSTGVRHTREPAYEPAATAPLPTAFSTETSAAQKRSSSRHSHTDENVTLERNTSTTSTNYSYASTDSRATHTSASSAAYTDASYNSQRLTYKRDSRPSTPKRWSDDTFGQHPGPGDSYPNRTYVSSSFLRRCFGSFNFFSL